MHIAWRLECLEAGRLLERPSFIVFLSACKPSNFLASRLFQFRHSFCSIISHADKTEK
jgi:hypothetical protein